MKKEIVHNNEKYLITVLPSKLYGYNALYISKRKKFLMFGYWAKISSHFISIKAASENLDVIVISIIKNFEKTKLEEETQKEQLKKYFK